MLDPFFCRIWIVPVFFISWRSVLFSCIKYPGNNIRNNSFHNLIIRHQTQYQS